MPGSKHVIVKSAGLEGEPALLGIVMDGFCAVNPDVAW
jgi:hypothetical protein